MRLKIGSRKSDLARIQSHTVGKALQRFHPGLEIEFHFKESLGDRNLTDPLWKMPERGVFTDDFVKDLENHNVDIVVHSWKDLPIENRPSTRVVATLKREDPRDLLILKKKSLGKKKVFIFTSSPRRSYNLQNSLPDLLPFECLIEFETIRGNVPTRIQKFADGGSDALILAKAAWDRIRGSTDEEFAGARETLKLCLSDCLWMVLPLSLNPAAAAQGALAIEILNERTSELTPILDSINDMTTFIEVQREREFLASYGGGCHQKIGVSCFSRDYGNVISLRGLTDQGERLQAWQLDSNRPIKQLTDSNLLGNHLLGRHQIWPLALGDVNLFTREPLAFDPRDLAENLFVSKSEALPNQVKPNGLIWTAGVETWRKLASKGHWVNGCFDGLGESEDMGIRHLGADVSVSPNSWTKLGHSLSAIDDSSPFNKCVATYGLRPTNSEVLAKELNEKEAFYWTSGSAFEQALKLAPEIINRSHACGPGSTYQKIQKMLGGDRKKIKVFLSHAEWLGTVQK